MKNISSVNDFKNELRRADPYEHAYIQRKAFVKKYGEAAKRFIEEIRQEERAEWVRKLKSSRSEKQEKLDEMNARFERNILTYKQNPDSIKAREAVLYDEGSQATNLSFGRNQGYIEAIDDLIQLIQGEDL